MIKYLTYIIVLTALMLGGVARADLADGPAYTLLWNRFEAVRSVGNYVVGVASEGVAVCQYDEALGQYVSLDQLLLDDRSIEMKLFGDVLVVKTLHDSLILIDVGRLPKLVRLGAMSPKIEFSDFVLHQDDLYISGFFEGILRFASTGLRDFHFADSVMKPILSTQMHLIGDTLVALDEYNGIVRYDLTTGGFGTFIDYLWIPFRVATFFPLGAGVIVSEINSGVHLGEFGHSGSGIVSTLGDFPAAQKFLLADTLMVLIENRFAYLRHRYTYKPLAEIDLGDGPIDGDIVRINDKYNLVMPGNDGGLVLHSLEQIGESGPAFYRPGPITALEMFDGRLFSGGGGNALDVYNITAVPPRLDFTIGSSPGSVHGLETGMGKLVALFGVSNRISLIANAADRDSNFIESSMSTGFTQGARVQYCDGPQAGEGTVLVWQNKRLNAYGLRDSSWFQPRAAWTLGFDVVGAAIIGNTLITATEKGNLLFYRIDDNAELTYLALMTVGNAASQLLVHDRRLLCFVGDDLLQISLGPALYPSVSAVFELELPVMQATIVEDRLYTVGGHGVAIYDLQDDGPVLVEAGGLPGKYIAATPDMLATSRGSSIHLYRLDRNAGKPGLSVPGTFTLSQNYPNPFNSSTIIRFSLPSPGRVELDVFNILGQRVNSLAGDFYNAGEHAVYWDGANSAGEPVASGIYFYRLAHGGSAVSRKMLLLK